MVQLHQQNHLKIDTCSSGVGSFVYFGCWKWNSSCFIFSISSVVLCDLAVEVPISVLGGWVSSLCSVKRFIWPNISARSKLSSVPLPVLFQISTGTLLIQAQISIHRYQKPGDFKWVRNMMGLFCIAAWKLSCCCLSKHWWINRPRYWKQMTSNLK